MCIRPSSASLWTLVLVASCSGGRGESGNGAPVPKPVTTAEPAATAPDTIDLQGAGATFPYPLYSKWVAEYQKIDAKVRINYQSIGSGGGIRQITERTVDFGATDAPMKEDELAKLSKPILHVPTTLGAVVIAYNLPGVDALKLSPELVAAIFSGELKKWNDPKLKALLTALLPKLEDHERMAESLEHGK